MGFDSSTRGKMAEKIDAPCYERTILFESEFFEVVSIRWSKTQTSQSHSHGWSQCYVSVEEGTFENTLDFGNKIERSLFEQGQAFTTPIGARHELKCTSTTGRTLHVYTPKVAELPDAGIFHSPSTDSLFSELKLGDATRLDALKKVLSTVRSQSISTYSPYFMNQLFSGVTAQMILGEDLIAQTRTTLATYEASPALSTIESEVVESLGALIGWEKNERDGVSVPGGSAANFMAIHCARQKKFPEIKQKGMSAHSVRIYVSDEAHYSFKKACAALGIGTDSLVHVPVNARGQMDPVALEALIKADIENGATPLIINATAGTTVLGAFDSIDDLSRISKKFDVWLHIDGAWGGPALFSKKLRPLLSSIELADSMTFDAHKLLGANLTCSFFLTKHTGLLLEANDVSGGDYLFHSDDPRLDRGKLSWQCGRSADAVSFWTIWKSTGNEGFNTFIDKLLAVRDETVAWIESQPRLELVAQPDFLNVCVRVRPLEGENADWSRHVRESLKQSNLALVNYSTDSQGTFLRLILAHPHLEFRHVRQILDWAQAAQ